VDWPSVFVRRHSHKLPINSITTFTKISLWMGCPENNSSPIAGIRQDERHLAGTFPLALIADEPGVR
jgi:hypothetical protein